MKVLLDSNVLISAFISRGLCSELFDFCVTNKFLYTSETILDEFSSNLIEKFKINKESVGEYASFIRRNSSIVSVLQDIPNICRDPNDNHVLAAGDKMAVDFIVTGDKDLLVLDVYNRIKIISPSIFWKNII